MNYIVWFYNGIFTKCKNFLLEDGRLFEETPHISRTTCQITSYYFLKFYLFLINIYWQYTNTNYILYCINLVICRVLQRRMRK